MTDNPKRNSEGYYDPTMYNGLRPIIAEKNALEPISRIELRKTKTGGFSDD